MSSAPDFGISQMGLAVAGLRLGEYRPVGGACHLPPMKFPARRSHRVRLRNW